ncbi:MAG: sensor histidine kinase [Nocardioides sp.]
MSTASRPRPAPADLALAVLVFIPSLLAEPPPSADRSIERDFSPLAIGLLVVSCGALVLRRGRPREVWALVVGLALVGTVLTDSPVRGVPAMIVAVYAVAAYVGRRWAIASGVVSVATALTVIAAHGALTWGDPSVYAVASWCGLAAALGDAVRSNRLVLREAVERARIAEQTRDEEALRRVAEERLRISRDLHDIVGHHLAVANVQSGLAQHLLDSDPTAAREALVHVRHATSQALEQTGQLVGLLRSDDGVPREPASTVDELPELVESLRTGGAEVRWSHHGAEIAVPAANSHHVYRVIQEGLTNAVRHGRGTVLLETTSAEGAVLVEITNEVASRPESPGQPTDRPSNGHGLVGMRERVALCGGNMETRISNGRHRLRIEIPARRASS